MQGCRDHPGDEDTVCRSPCLAFRQAAPTKSISPWPAVKQRPDSREVDCRHNDGPDLQCQLNVKAVATLGRVRDAATPSLTPTKPDPEQTPPPTGREAKHPSSWSSTEVKPRLFRANATAAAAQASGRIRGSEISDPYAEPDFDGVRHSSSSA